MIAKPVAGTRTNDGGKLEPGKARMRIHRIFTRQGLRPGHSVTLPAEVAHYLTRVLRTVTGQNVILFNGDGSDYTAEISGFGKESVTVAVRSALPARTESALHITLVQAISRGERMDLTLQKATELGVSAVQPVFSARTEVRLNPEKMQRRLEHWHRVIISACEQCGRACLPVLHDPAELLVWMQQKSAASRVLLTPAAGRSLAGFSPGAAVEIVVGPEGGFEDHEFEALTRHGAVPVSLGPRILRTETAGPVAIAIMQAVAGDLA